MRGFAATASSASWRGSSEAAAAGCLYSLVIAVLVYRNFDSVYLEWNKSLVYSTTAAYLATRLGGAKRYNAGSPDQGLSDAQMKQLQKKLRARGHDVGKIDGILGAGTRAAVRAEQKRLGMPADAWPTAALLNKL